MAWTYDRSSRYGRQVETISIHTTEDKSDIVCIQVRYDHCMPFIRVADIVYFAHAFDETHRPKDMSDGWEKLPLNYRLGFGEKVRLFSFNGGSSEFETVDLPTSLELIRTMPIVTTDEHRERACAFLCTYFHYTELPRPPSPPPPPVADTTGCVIDKLLERLANCVESVEGRLGLLRMAFADYKTYCGGFMPTEIQDEFIAKLLTEVRKIGGS